MSTMRASNRPCSAKTALAASTSRARVRAALGERGLAGATWEPAAATSSPPSSPIGLGRSVLANLEGLGEGAAHDELLVLDGKVFDDLAVGERVAHALGVREVRAE